MQTLRNLHHLHQFFFKTERFIFLSFFLFSNLCSAAIITSTAAGGTWSAGGTWVGGVAPVAGDDAIIATTVGNSVTLGAAASITNITINNSATFNDGNFTLTVSGNIVINGLYQGNGTGRLNWTGTGVTLDGVGTINNINRLDPFASTTKTILSTANITFTGANQRIDMRASTFITNNGTVTLKTITQADATATWVNAANATLNISEAIFTTSTLTATAAGNTVNYNGSIAQTIRATSYYHLKYTGSNTGTLGGNINIAGDFTVSSGTFAPSTFTTTFNGTAAAQNIYGGGTFTFQNLTLNNTYGTIPQLIFNTNVTAKVLLTMTSGVVNLAGNTFTLGVSATASTLTRTASTTTNWFYGGTFKRFWLDATTLTSTSGNYYGLFPMGTVNASSYRPVQINTTGNITTAGFFTVNHVDAPNTYIDLSPVYNDAGTNITRILNAQFNTAISGVTAGTFSISATMTGLDPGTLADVRLAIFTGGTTASAVGTHAAATGTADNPTASRSGITTMADLNNDFRIATTNVSQTPLPIELLAFDAKQNGNSVNVQWSTAAELNSDYFLVQRSKDGIYFSDVTRVNAAGNSSTTRKYSTEDYEPYNGVSYYRLKQVDYDGKFSYSDVVAVQLHNEDAILVYPNPATQGEPFNVSISGENGKEVLVVIHDVQGREFYSKINTISSHREVIAIAPFGKLATGIYCVTVSSDKAIYKKRVVIK
ncbi:MAG: T9SS type A sorting domain-containing protein [Bacteroidetes bacterium]|nr:T9SS type A sorting domain-containing protein [Bacteroidota bacterium]